MKILFRIGIVLFLLVIGGFFFVGYNLDAFIKSGVENGGTFALGVDTRLAGADLKLMSGDIALDGLEIDNPEGFAAAHFFEMNNAAVSVDRDSLSTDTVRIQQVVLDGITLEVERKGGETNYGQILKNLERFESGETETGDETPTEPAPEGEKKFQVDQIVLKDIKANVRVEVLGDMKEFSVPIPDYTIENVGNADSSQSVGDLLSTVLQDLLDSVVSQGKGLLPEDLLTDMNGKLAGIKDKASELTNDLKTKLDDTFQGLDADGIKDKAKGTLDAAKEGLNGLLNRDGE